MTQEEISARANAYEQHTLRLIFLIYLCAGSLTVIVAGFFVWLLSR